MAALVSISWAATLSTVDRYRISCAIRSLTCPGKVFVLVTSQDNCASHMDAYQRYSAGKSNGGKERFVLVVQFV